MNVVEEMPLLYECASFGYVLKSRNAGSWDRLATHFLNETAGIRKKYHKYRNKLLVTDHTKGIGQIKSLISRDRPSSIYHVNLYCSCKISSLTLVPDSLPFKHKMTIITSPGVLKDSISSFWLLRYRAPGAELLNVFSPLQCNIAIV